MNDWLPWLDRKGRFSTLRAATFALMLVPALWLAWDAWMGQLGSKPWTRAVHDTGTWTVRILVLTLAISPFRRILDWPQLVGVRRMVGLFVMFYALAHLTLYCIDLAFDWGLIVSEIAKRFYLVVGFTALLGLVALGVTSTDAMIRRLGSARWQRLHNLVYVIAALGLLHFALQSKLDVTQPVLMTGLFALLMVYRLMQRFGIPYDTLRLVAAAVFTGFLTALCETAWYAFATGASAWLVFQANFDAFTYGDVTFLRPGHWVLFAGLAVALAHAWRAPAPRKPRRERAQVPAQAGS